MVPEGSLPHLQKPAKLKIRKMLFLIGYEQDFLYYKMYKFHIQSNTEEWTADVSFFACAFQKWSGGDFCANPGVILNSMHTGCSTCFTTDLKGETVQFFVMARIGSYWKVRKVQNRRYSNFYLFYFFNLCTVYFDIYNVHTPTNALFIKLEKVLKFTLKITLTFSYMFRSTTVIREPSLEPS